MIIVPAPLARPWTEYPCGCSITPSGWWVIVADCREPDHLAILARMMGAAVEDHTRDPGWGTVWS